MKKYIYVITMIGFLGLGACDLEKDCSGTVSASYSIGTDVTSDFSVSEAATTAEVLSSDCDSLSVGQTVEESIDTIVRSGDTITVTEGEEVINMTLSGDSVNEFTRSHTIAGCTVTVILNGSLDSETNTIVTSGAFAAKGLTCTSPL